MFLLQVLGGEMGERKQREAGSGQEVGLAPEQASPPPSTTRPLSAPLWVPLPLPPGSYLPLRAPGNFLPKPPPCDFSTHNFLPFSS